MGKILIINVTYNKRNIMFIISLQQILSNRKLILSKKVILNFQ